MNYYPFQPNFTPGFSKPTKTYNPSILSPSKCRNCGKGLGEHKVTEKGRIMCKLESK